jgi:hypothetical protein
VDKNRNCVRSDVLNEPFLERGTMQKSRQVLEVRNVANILLQGLCASRRIDEATGCSNDGHAEHTNKEAIIKFHGKGMEILLQIVST